MIFNILLCDTFPGLLPESIPSYGYMFEKLFSAVEADSSFNFFCAYKDERPSISSAVGAVNVISGSNCAAYDDLPWIVNLQQWVRDAVAEKAPIVGICFGHQLIAKAMGGEVERYSGGWGAGVRKSHTIDKTLSPYFQNGFMQLLYNHHDQVVKMPQGAVPLATSSFCKYEGFRIDGDVITFQGHPEFTKEYLHHLIINHSEDEVPDIKESALKSLQLYHDGNVIAKYIIDFFKDKFF